MRLYPVICGLSLLTACSQQPAVPPTPFTPPPAAAVPEPATENRPAGDYYAAKLGGDYAGYPETRNFIERMHTQYGYPREYLYGLFSQAKRKQGILNYLQGSGAGGGGTPAPGGWTRYRAQFLDQGHIHGGVAFWKRHEHALRQAHRQYQVPPEYIVAIIGVETSFGQNVGKHRIIDALTTLAFDFPRRADYFQGELEKFLQMSAEEHIDPSQPLGSYAGAMGYGQFMPSSFLQWAVDHNQDGRRDLWNAEDAIGSVANYFAAHGWQAGQPVVSPLKTQGPVELAAGLDHTYTLSELAQTGLRPTNACACEPPLRLLWLRHANHEEYLLGHPNFYTISRYNHSTYYSMAVHELAQAIKRQKDLAG